MEWNKGLRDRALDWLLEGQAERAIPVFEAHVAALPNDARAWVELGTAYAATERYEDAARALGRGVEGGADRIEPWILWVEALVHTGAYPEARAALDRIGARGEGDARLDRIRGIVHYHLGNLDEAERCLDRALNTLVPDARTEYALGFVLEARRDHAGAIERYRRAVALDPTFLAAYRSLADALAMVGEHGEALAVLGALLQRCPDDPAANQNVVAVRRAASRIGQGRLLGQGTAALERSSLFTEGAFRRVGDGAGPVVRYAAPLVELWATLSDGASVKGLFLVLTDPERAARTEDDRFKVAVVGTAGPRRAVDFATAVHLTFLREALGTTLTEASALYTRLFQGAPAHGKGPFLRSGDVEVALETGEHPTRPGQPRHGLAVRLLAT